MRLALAAGLVLAAGVPSAHGQAAPSAPYTEVFYPSGALRIQAYLYRPDGPGPFPAVIYNHGSRPSARERQSVRFEHIGRSLTQAGYVVLVSERRGFGRSDGPTWSQEVGVDRTRVVPRLQAEADDVLAAVPYLRALPFVDGKRLGIMGWSFGGIVTLFAVSRSREFSVAVDQAGGAMTWDRNPAIPTALLAAADRVATPTLLLVAQNDRTTASITAVGDVLQRRGIPHRVVIYPPFAPRRTLGGEAPGHQVFGAQGMSVWEADVLEFLGRHVGRGP
ncbi:MAG TPA: prolyl oligopeptidase family serine peptidase [Methylomirabilota bacterium]|nr:prolyl oligopeptidase family serine peptidase [Methylomirabilota bacterium]